MGELDLPVYEQKPEIKIKNFNQVYEGYDEIVAELLTKLNSIKKKEVILAVECYPGVSYKEVLTNLIDALHPKRVFISDEYFIDPNTMNELLIPILTEDKVFGIMSHYEFSDFLDEKKKNYLQEEINGLSGLIVILGTGASVLYEQPDVMIYADLSRWEIQLRHRNGMGNWNADNEHESIKKKYKRGFFFEWRTADRLKQKVYHHIDYLLDTTLQNDPKMLSGGDYRQALREVVQQPFRLVPYFDTSVWGGQWMKERFNLEPTSVNYGWGFDGVPEENSIIINVDGVKIEIPSINLVFAYPKELLGEKVYAQFGKEFPIRFDFLDTVRGGNLSLQVHPLVDYIQDKYGMLYTQDESYYILSSGEKSSIYLGLKKDINMEELEQDLRKSERGNYRFPDEKYVNHFPVKRHDHYSIPAGTIHCSGPDTVVLEISATPYIFTFKLWDWGRMDLDGQPRPIHLNQGLENIQVDRDTDWVEINLIHSFKGVPELGDEEHEVEKTGLHELEFIETKRHWFKGSAMIENHDGFNMLNLVDGEKITVESLDGKFQPFEVHYAETFIVPATIQKYKLVNQGDLNQPVAVIQAYVRN